MRMRALSIFIALVAPLQAWAESDASRDTRDRHERASRSDDDDRSSSSGDDDDDDDSGWSGADDDSSCADCAPTSGSFGVAPLREAHSLPVDFLLRTFVVFDRLRGTQGGEVQKQDGLGAGLAFDLVFFGPQSDSSEGGPIRSAPREVPACRPEAGMRWCSSEGGPIRSAPREVPACRPEAGMRWCSSGRLGFALSAGLSWSHLLDDFRPEGELYTSNLGLLAVEADFGPRWVERSGAAELMFGVGAGLTFLRAFESFSDGLELNETLAVGARLRPYAGLAIDHHGLIAGRTFFEIGLVGFAGDVTEHETEYDSLIAGLEPLMVTPYIRLGELFRITDGAMIGLNYQLEMIGSALTPPSLAHQFVVMFRFFDLESRPFLY